MKVCYSVTSGPQQEYMQSNTVLYECLILLLSPTAILSIGRFFTFVSLELFGLFRLEVERHFDMELRLLSTCRQLVYFPQVPQVTESYYQDSTSFHTLVVLQTLDHRNLPSGVLNFAIMWHLHGRG